jgi:hypothetical protein
MIKKVLALLVVASSVAFGSVNISTTTVSGQSITVNTSATDGFSAANGGQGVCLSSPANVCGVVTSTPTGTQFVLLVAGTTPAACASSCGTASPAPQVIVLSTSTTQGFTTWTWLNWVTTQQPCPGPAASGWASANGSSGATAAQISAIKNGLFIEHSRSLTLASSTVIATVETLIQSDYSTDQASAAQPCQFYGFTFDPTSNAWVKQ